MNDTQSTLLHPFPVTRARTKKLCTILEPPTHSKAERRGYYAHVNKGHIPDLKMIRFGSTTTCWESKCYTPFLPFGAKGNGSARCGGAASRADGHIIGHCAWQH